MEKLQPGELKSIYMHYLNMCTEANLKALHYDTWDYCAEEIKLLMQVEQAKICDTLFQLYKIQEEVL